jgi:hypothetical protein
VCLVIGEKDRRTRLAVIVYPLLVALVVVLITLMVLRHEPLIWPEHRRIYYFLPITALFLFTVGLAVRALRDRGIVSERVLQSVLLLLVIGNVWALPGHRAILANGYLKRTMQLSPKVLQALREHVSPENADPNVAKDKLYQFFVSGRDQNVSAVQ